MRISRLKIGVFSALAALASVGVLADGLAAPGSTWLTPAQVRSADPREVMLTFDDGPSPYTGQVLDILRREHMKATFFLCGANAERYPELVRRIRDEGHAIGNHTWSHRYLYLSSRAELASEIDRTQDALEKITGTRPVLFRPPFGVRGFPLDGVLRERGMKMMLWSDRGHDGALDADGVTKTTLAQLGPGAIVLLHDGYEVHEPSLVDRSATVKALPAIIAGVRAAGYLLAPSATELAGRSGPAPRKG